MISASNPVKSEPTSLDATGFEYPIKNPFYRKGGCLIHMKIKELSIRELVKILNDHQYYDVRHNSNHHVFERKGCEKHIAVSFHEKTVNPHIAKSILKSANIIL